MARMINADALKAKITEALTSGDTGRMGELISIVINAVIDEQPTVEERKGKWKRVSAVKYISHSDYVFMCSSCGKKYIGAWNYCPNCGARMTGEQT